MYDADKDEGAGQDVQVGLFVHIVFGMSIPFTSGSPPYSQ
jgi:hypothetical protein